MQIFGIDFTSAPTRRKPITCALCALHDDRLTLQQCLSLPTFEEFEVFLQRAGPWCAAFDFPFGLPRPLLANLGWPQQWEDTIQFVAALGKAGFEESITRYCAGQPPGQKLLLRATDVLARSRSPMMLHRVPVGKMFFQGATRLLQSGVNILPCRPNTDSRIVLEGYPALVARRWLGLRSYKSDERARQTQEQLAARRVLMQALCSPALFDSYSLHLNLPDPLAETLISDPMADLLDALLCAIQSAWAYTQRTNGYGIPRGCDGDEGWIVDPALFS